MALCKKCIKVPLFNFMKRKMKLLMKHFQNQGKNCLHFYNFYPPPQFFYLLKKTCNGEFHNCFSRQTFCYSSLSVCRLCKIAILNEENYFSSSAFRQILFCRKIAYQDIFNNNIP